MSNTNHRRYIIEFVPDYSDEAEFLEDMAYLRSLGAALLEHAGHLLPNPPETSIYARLKADISGAARRAIFGPMPTFENCWDAA